MSAAVWPPLPADELKKQEDASTANELAWLLESLQETLQELKSGLEDCYALLAPIEPGSTLVMSSPRSESIKGHITRVGTRIIRGSLHLRLRTHPPIHLTLSSSPTPTPLILPALTTLRALLNQSLDCVDITRWTGDRHSSSFISSQLLLLHQLILESLSLLKGPRLLEPTNPTPGSTPPHLPPPQSSPPPSTSWCDSPLDPQIFACSPNPNPNPTPLPPHLSLDLALSDTSLILTIRILEPVSKELNLGERFAFAIGAQRRLEHDEMDEVFVFRGEEVRVREKVRVEGSADPCLLSLGAKLGALEAMVRGWRIGLGVVMGLDVEG